MPTDLPTAPATTATGRTGRVRTIVAVALAAALAAVLAVTGAGCTTAASSAPHPAAGPPATPAVARSGRFRLVVEPDDGIGPIYRLLSSPRRSLDLVMYELADPTAVRLLVADAHRGVRVRVLLDRNREGARNAAAFAALRSGGVDVRWAPPGYEATHEKAFVVDGRQLVVLTLNLTARYYADTRDVAVVDDDPADASAVESVFAADLAGRYPTVPPPRPDLVWSPGAEPALVALIGSAHRSLQLETEELTDRAVIDALTSAAARHVDVVVTMTDQGETAEAAELRAGGVHLHLRPPDASVYIHAKVIVVDDRTAWVGSQNLSSASLDRNRELGVVVSAPAVVASLVRMLRADAAAPSEAPG